MKNTVEVWLKPEFMDAEGLAARHELAAAGMRGLKNARAGKIFEIEGGLDKRELKRIADEILADKITEDLYINDTFSPDGTRRAEVWLKGSASDVVGESVQEAVLDAMGIRCKVRCGAAYVLTGGAGGGKLERAVNKTLANPIIHECRIK